MTADPMSRTLSDDRCPDCGKTPERSNDGKVLCACEGKRWKWVGGVEGTSEEAEMLKTHRFEFMHDANGDNFYGGPFGRLVWLYVDGTWRGEPRPKVGTTLEGYLKEVSQVA